MYFKIYALYFLQKSVSDFQQLTKAVKCGFRHLFFRLFRRSLSLSETDCGVRCCTLLILLESETAEKRTFAFGLPNKAMDEHSHAGKKPQIAVVNRNTLAANGLTSLIEGVMPMAEVAVFNKMSDIPESSLPGFFHFFISADVLFENREYFVGQCHKTIVVTEGDRHPTIPACFRTLDATLNSHALLREFLRMEQMAHGGGRKLPEEMKQSGNMTAKSPELTPREIEVLHEIVMGHINKEIADKLMQEGYNADSLHGELSQAQRDAVMQKFRQRNIQILVATDVAARGLDVNDLTHVINYGLPDDTESYTHRSGRTGRAGKTGISIAIVNMREKGKMREIERIIGKKFIMEQVPTGKQICEKQLIKVIDDIEKVKVNEEEIADFMPDIYRKLEWLSKEDVIKRMVSMEFNRFLEYYRDREEIQTATDSRGERGSREDRGGREGGSRKAAPGFTRLFINLGKMDNFFPSELISLLNSNTRGRIELGRIDLMKNFSFFEVEEKETQNVIKALNRANWNGRRVSVEIAGEEGGEGRRNSDRSNDKSGVKGRNGRSKDTQKDNSTSASAKPRKEKASKTPASTDSKKQKPSREERGYKNARGKKDDWKQFFKDEEPDFSEEGWARRKPKKK